MSKNTFRFLSTEIDRPEIPAGWHEVSPTDTTKAGDKFWGRGGSLNPFKWMEAHTVGCFADWTIYIRKDEAGPGPVAVPSDREQLTAMLTRAGIKFEEEVSAESVEDIIVGRDSSKTRKKVTPGKITVTVEGGYIGFVSVFEFDLSGKLLTVGAYE